MINRASLLADLQRVLTGLEADLRERSDSDEVPEVREWLQQEYARAKEAGRTAQTRPQWIDEFITQVAAAWVLSCVFVRFLEDNGLIEPPRIAGPGPRLGRARDEYTLYFQDPARAALTDREYLLDVFATLAKLPATAELFGEHNPLQALPNWLGPDAAGELRKFFQKIDADTGELVHDFTDPDWDTRFLGDLYQDLSEAARKRYALLQTPEFVEEFILDRTLDPALDEFGLEPSGQRSAVSGQKEKAESRQLNADRFRMIDPACGSGHFLLGAFPRILARWQRQEPDTNVRELVQRTLDSIHGVDVNPYAIAIARFRLLLAAMRACGITRLADAPAFRLQLVVGDSLLHGQGSQLGLGWSDVEHATAAEDLPALNRILVPGRYHAVVANPPYITPKDKALNAAYRERYASCHRQYSLAVPFLERIVRLAVSGEGAVSGQQSAVSNEEADSRQLTADSSRAAGYTGQITANSFMKREFGKKLIEEFLPKVDLTHVIDTSGAYIPGHGTPTVILFARNRKPVAGAVRAVLGIRGEPSTPDDPAAGLVWSAITRQIDQPGSESEFVSVDDVERDRFGSHPWSIQGGGAAALKERLDATTTIRLGDVVDEIGFGAVTREDEVYRITSGVCRRRGIESKYIRPLAAGEEIRDWQFEGLTGAIWPYDAESLKAAESDPVCRVLWRYRRQLSDRVAYGYTQLERGLQWFEYSMFFDKRFRTPLSIVFAFVATHNHFVLDRGGKVFKQSAPVIKLPAGAGEEDHLALLGLLNSSTACFWMKQVFYPKGGDHVGQEGARVRRTLWDERFEFAGTGLQQYPLPADRPFDGARQLDTMAAVLSDLAPSTLLKAGRAEHHSETLAERHLLWEATRQQMIALQEELDWECYRLYGLLDEELTTDGPPTIAPGQRAFEIVLARKVAAGEVETTWFERHGSTPITQLPAEWPDDYRRLVERRTELIESNKNIGLIQRPEYKRRWNTEPWEDQLERALREWLLDRLESYFDFDGRMNDEETPTARLDVGLVSLGELADVAGRDEQFHEVAALYRDDPAFDVQRLVEELVTAESVPLLPVLRYKPPGLRKRQQWEQTWELQRREDAINERLAAISDQLSAVSDDDEKAKLTAERRQLSAELEELTIPVPPKYASSDFIATGGARYWSLRGKLDVPEERWISFPHCEAEDGTLMICWAGCDHLQQATAIAAWYVRIKEELGGADDPRLIPLLGCLVELLPWLKQWHNTPHPDYDGLHMGDYYEGFIAEEARTLGKTVEAIRGWEPPKKTRGRRADRSG